MRIVGNVHPTWDVGRLTFDSLRACFPSMSRVKCPMSHVRCLGFLGLLLTFVTSAHAEHRSIDLESLRIIIDSDWAQQGASGYFPVRFDITNLGEAREIVLIATQQHWFRTKSRSVFGALDNGRIDIRQSISLKRGDRVKFTMALPVFAEESFQFHLEENGRRVQAFSSSESFQGGHTSSESPVLTVTSPSSPLALLVTPRPIYHSGMFPMPTRMPPPAAGGGGIIAVATGPSPVPGLPPLDFSLEPERLPTNWIGFTSLRAVLIGPSEWRQLNPAQQEALRTWTAAGGDLLLVDGTPDTIFPADQRPIGLGHFSSVLPYFLGHLHLLKSEDIRERGFENTLLAVDSAVPIYDMSLPAVRSRDWSWIGERGFRLPIEGVGEVPTRAYLLILFLFVLVIGPLNYIYLWRKKRQVLLVVTVPLFSIAFIALLTGYAFFLQGFGVRSRVVTFTVLDQNSKRAATRSSASLYPGGFRPSGGVRFTSDAAIFPMGIDGTGPRGNMTLDLTQEQRWQTGFLRARTPGNFDQISVRPARERMSIRREGDRLQVVNGLGAPLRQLVYRDGGQTWSLGTKVSAGGKADLKADKSKPADMFGKYLNDAGVTRPKFQNIVDNQPDHSYLAVLETSPFWDPGVANADERQSFHLVLGYLDEQP